MPLLRLRVSNELTDFLIEVAIWCDKLDGSRVTVCCEEISKKGVKHIHLVTNYDKSTATFRRQFTKQFPQLVGNKCLSVSEADSSEEINNRYVCKGPSADKLPTILLANITHEQIVEHHTEFWKNNLKYCHEQTLQRITEQNHIHKEKTKKKSWMEKITEEFIKSHNIPKPIVEKVTEELYSGLSYTKHVGSREVEWIQPTYVHSVNGEIMYIKKLTYNKTDMKIIQKYIMKKLGKSAKILDEFVVKRMCLGLLNALCDGEDQDLNDSMFGRAFPDL